MLTPGFYGIKPTWVQTVQDVQIVQAVFGRGEFLELWFVLQRQLQHLLIVSFFDQLIDKARIDK
jgi:hypothetical protein